MFSLAFDTRHGDVVFRSTRGLTDIHVSTSDDRDVQYAFTHRLDSELLDRIILTVVQAQGKLRWPVYLPKYYSVPAHTTLRPLLDETIHSDDEITDQGLWDMVDELVHRPYQPTRLHCCVPETEN